MENYDEPASRIGGSVGANIFRVRRQLRMTQKQLAIPEFSISYISAIERGRIRPSLKALEVLARRLNVTSAELLANIPGDYQNDTSGSDGPASEAMSMNALLRQRPAGQQVSMTLGLASIYLVRHDYSSAVQMLESLNSSTLSVEQRLLRFYFLGATALAENRHEEALGFLEPVLKQDEYNDHAELLERCRFIVGCVYEAQDQFLPALDAFTACAQAIERGIVDEPVFTFQVHFALAEHHRRLERREVAIAWYQQALSQFPFILDPTALADSSFQLSQRHLQNVHSTLADWYAARSRVLYELVGARQLFTQASANFGLILQETGNIPTAEQQLRQTIEYCKLLSTPHQGILTNIALADLLLERQEAAEAERLALDAKELCRPSGEGPDKDDLLYGRILFPHPDDTLYGRILVTLADAIRAQGRLDEAERLFQEAIELLKQLHAKHQNANEHLSQAYFRYSTLLNQKGMVTESYEMVRQAFLLSTRREVNR